MTSGMACQALLLTSCYAICSCLCLLGALQAKVGMLLGHDYKSCQDLADLWTSFCSGSAGVLPPNSANLRSLASVGGVFWFAGFHLNHLSPWRFEPTVALVQHGKSVASARPRAGNEIKGSGSVRLSTNAGHWTFP